MKTQRFNARRNDELRRLSVTFNSFTQADGSVLLQLGKTTVLCSVTMQSGVPRFLKGKGVGWLTAEYAMLPAATATRTQRACTQANANGRSVEISRFIGRVLRATTDLERLGERTIHIDCDVLCADGGTRTASIIAATIALRYAQRRWLEKKEIMFPFIRDSIAALSVGIVGDTVLLDPDYQEDAFLDADLNFVMTQSGALIEIQGGAEKNPIEWHLFDQVRTLVEPAMQTIFSFIEQQSEIALPTGTAKTPVDLLKKHFMNK